MSETPASGPAPGWYADPEIAGNLRYWDGASWQQRWSDSGAASSGPRPVGPGFFRLGAVVQQGLLLLGLVLGLQAALYIWGLAMFDEAIGSGDIDLLERYDELDIATSIAVLVLMLAIGICWARWQYLLARAARPGDLTRGPGWHAWAWFVPVVALWFPFQNVRDLWRRRFPHRSLDLLGWWWAGWIATLVLDRVYLTMETEPGSVSDLKNLTVLGLVSAVVNAATLVLALIIVRDLTDAERTAGQVSPEAPTVG